MDSNQQMLLRVDEQDAVPVVAILCSEMRSDHVIARLEQELLQWLSSSGSRQIVLDLSAVHFMASSGLRVLIVLRKQLRELGGRFVMCGVHKYVAEVFRTTRLFTERFDYVDSVEDALAAIKAPAGPAPQKA